MSKITYRPEIDFLRAIAISSVFLFHLDKSILPGGFVGVDIFFVISGYLITSIIINDIEKEKFSFLVFYQRRIARIFPVFAVVLVATLGGASFIYSSLDFASAGAVGIAAMLSMANIKLLFQGDYFKISPDAQPFLHYWSLSVEEQYYLVFPATLLILYKFSQSPRNIKRTILVVAAISAFLSMYFTKSYPVAAFYLLPTRAWELLAGASVSLIRFYSADNKTVSSVFYLEIVVGFLLIIVSFFIFNEKTPFPGYAALLPVTGTLLLIYVQHDYSNDWLGKLIISRPIVYLGVISYSLYLWHWPIFSFINYELYAAPSVERSLLKISASLLLAIISYHILEKPARIFLNKPSRKYFGFLVFLSVTSAIIWISFYIHTENHVSAESWQVASGGIAINKQIDKTCIMLMGDSNASMYGNSIKSLAEKLNIKAQIISVDAGNPLPNSKLWNDSINAIKTAKPDYVIFAASWSGKINSIGKQEKLLLALNEINKYSKFIVLITQPQILPEQGTRDYIQKHGITKVVEEKEEYAFRNSANSYIKLLANDRISVLDIEDAFYGHDQEIKFLDSNGNYLYQDSRHLSGLGAAVVINNYLAPMLIGHSNQYLTCASNGHAKSTRR